MGSHPARILEEHRNHGSKRPLDFTFNQDGTISPVSQPRLCLGCQFMPTSLAQNEAMPVASAVPMADAVPMGVAVPLATAPVMVAGTFVGGPSASKAQPSLAE